MYAAEDTWTIQTDVFEGPLDLLLYLVKRDRIDLKNLQIATIADSYLAYLDTMRGLRLNIASEYLVMAATLVQMKSLQLLPRLPVLVEEGDAPDPAAELARKLLEYQRFKEASVDLDARPMLDRDVFRRPSSTQDAQPEVLETECGAFELLEIYYHLLKSAKQGPVVHRIGHSGPNMRDCCNRVLSFLGTESKQQLLSDLLLTSSQIDERIVMFIAVLEMVRLQWISIAQDRHLGPVALKLRSDAVINVDELTGRIEATGEPHVEG